MAFHLVLCGRVAGPSSASGNDLSARDKENVMNAAISGSCSGSGKGSGSGGAGGSGSFLNIITFACCGILKKGKVTQTLFGIIHVFEF